jgi:2-oxo-4-hydroxy-4-carboxy-5-ureidoimidazoline decarboxylase
VLQWSAEHLIGVCSSRRWAQLVAASGPYETVETVLEAAELAFDQLEPDDWHAGIRGHARIAEPPTDDEREAREQSGVLGADADTLAALRDGNAAYEARFGHIFLIRATGRSAAEMLAALQERLGNPSDAEFHIATQELREITRLRLRELAGVSSAS